MFTDLLLKQLVKEAELPDAKQPVALKPLKQPKRQIVDGKVEMTTPCKNGHMGLRYAANGNRHCVQCAKDDAREAARRSRILKEVVEGRKPMTAREIAKSAGAFTYMTGKPCRRGHLGERYTSSGQCVACTQLYTENQAVKRRSGT